MVGVKSEKIDHKNCTPREPNGQNELSFLPGREREERRSLGWRILFLLVTNAVFKDLFFLFQTSITPINTDCNCADWKGDPIHSVVTWASELLESPLLVLSNAP